VLLSEAGVEMQPPQFPHGPVARLRRPGLFDGKLFTLERNAYRFAGVMPTAARSSAAGRSLPMRCRPPLRSLGLAEALVIDADGAWIGLDNNNGARADGERPIVWRFAAPEGGWSAKP
jgi:hypothetical protein